MKVKFDFFKLSLHLLHQSKIIHFKGRDMNKIIVCQPEELRQLVMEAVMEADMQRQKARPEKLLTINQVAKQLGKAHQTIKKYVEEGIIRSTPNGLIPNSAIEDFIAGDS